MKHIEVGDTVMVTRPSSCCGDTVGLYEVAQVYEIARGVEGDEFECSACGDCTLDVHVRLTPADEGCCWCEIARVVKINPLQEEEKREEAITA